MKLFNTLKSLSQVKLTAVLECLSLLENKPVSPEFLYDNVFKKYALTVQEFKDCFSHENCDVFGVRNVSGGLWIASPLTANRGSSTGNESKKQETLYEEPNFGIDPFTQERIEQEAIAQMRDYDSEIEEIISFFNELTQKDIKATASNKTFIRTILAAGYSIQDCKYVIVNKFKQWHEDPKMDSFIRISTLFKSIDRFDEYKNEPNYVNRKPTSNSAIGTFSQAVGNIRTKEIDWGLDK